MGKREAWHSTLAEIGEKRGFYKPLGEMHKALFLKGDSTLVVSFDNLDDVRQDMENQMPWGSQFISSQGWSSLGIGAHGWTWYREDAVLDFFDQLRQEKFFDQFDNVVFYGTSMAGYAATVFCAAAPGARVIAMSPQATLERRITHGWESRFHRSWRQDFSGRYSFGPKEALSAETVYLFFDPVVTEDAMHAALYQGENIIKLKCRYFGHGLTSAFQQMGILKTIVRRCVNKTPSQTELYKILTARKMNPKYQKTMLRQLEGQERHRLVYDYCKAVLERSGGKPRPHFRNAMNNSAKFISL